MTKILSHGEHHARMVKMAHPDAKEDRAMIKKMVKPAALTGRKHGGAAHPDEREDRAIVKRMVKPDALTGRARGGVAPGKGKGKDPKSQTNILIAPRGGEPRAGAPLASPAAMPAPAGANLPSRPAVPVMPPRPPVPAGPGGGLGALQGVKHGGKVHAQKRASGGEVGNVTKPHALKGYDAGAGSGEGRLEKMSHYGTKAKTPLKRGSTARGR